MAQATEKQGNNGRKGATGGHMPPADARLDEIARILALGILRLPDLYSRMHGAGIIDTLGAANILIGLAFEPAHWTVVVKLLSILFFLYVTSATATHALAHAAWTSGLEPVVGDDAPDPSEMRT